MFDIANQLLTRHSHFAPLGFVDEWTAKPSPSSIQGHFWRNFLGLRQLKHWKIRTTYRQWQSSFSRRGRKPKYGKKNRKLFEFSGFGNGISRGWERKPTTERFSTGRFWPYTWKISSVGRDQFNNWQFCILKITPIVYFCIVSMHFFILCLSANALYDFIRGLSTLLFLFIYKVDFSFQWRAIVVIW